MTVALAHPALPLAQPAAPTVEVVVPVHNEQAKLETHVRRLHAYLSEHLPVGFHLTIADNASTDETWPIARRLERSLSRTRALRREAKGRGGALREAWQASDAEVLAYMDVDLSTDLAALLPLVAPLLSRHSDLAIGTRLARASRVERGAKREIVSRSYNLILHIVLRSRFSDAQCGFKAIRADRARELLPQVEDDGWFFDTELLVLAERGGMRIHEVPVDWVDDPDSRVDIVATALTDLRGIRRLRQRFAAQRRARTLRQLVSFCVIGAASTLAYAVLYLLLRGALPAQAANAVALLLTAIANTAANRRLTFGVRGRQGRLRHQAQGLIVFALGLAVTSGSLAALYRYDPTASHGTELAVLVVASVVATLLRFLLFRGWLFPQRLPTSGPATTTPGLAATSGRATTASGQAMSSCRQATTRTQDP
jgi:putative flippase GtrA